ncbi:MAG: nitrite reductase small subunit NirD [Actinomycetales bacterium]|nr:nitrite reductase small subunit NirD [Actinomycetales bacterium]
MSEAGFVQAGTTTADGGGSDADATLTWVGVCRVTDLEPERGAAALLGADQLALVRLLDDSVLAVQQLDPFSGAYVISRGIVGSRVVDGEERPTIASPMYKQVFDLGTGACLDPVGGEPQALRTWPVRVVDGEVQVGLAPEGSDGEALGAGVPGAGLPGGGV